MENLTDQNETLQSYVGKKIRLEKVGQIVEGVLIEANEKEAYENKLFNSNIYWFIETSDGRRHTFAPNDGWAVTLID